MQSIAFRALPEVSLVENGVQQANTTLGDLALAGVTTSDRRVRRILRDVHAD